MKAGLTSSTLMHVVLIGAGLVSFSSPRSLEVADVEALPVELISIGELTQLQQGAENAPLLDRASPERTERQDPVPEADRAGEQDRNFENDVRDDAPVKPIERTADAAPQATPDPRPLPIEETPVEAPQPETRPEVAPTNELAVETQPRQEVTPEPVPQAEPEPEAQPQAEFAETPTSVPAPQSRPERPRPQTAQTTERRAEESQQATRQQPSEETSLEDDIAALINRERASGGGAARSDNQASLGATRTTGGERLTASEMDALRQQIQKCWNPPFGMADADGLRVTIKMQLNQAGEIEGRPKVVSGGGNSGAGRAAAESARRAVMICAPYRLPAEKFDTWRDVVVNFDPSQMFR